MKICAPSFIVPATRGENVDFLTGLVDEVQLLFLDSKQNYDIPKREETEELRSKDMKYSFHLPTDIDLLTKDGWAKLKDFYIPLSSLNPQRCILHPENSHKFLESALKFKEETGANLVIENTDFYGKFFDDVIEAGLSICFDNAHAYKNGHCEIEFMEKYAPYISEFHLQGREDGKEHKSLLFLDKTVLEYLINCAKLNNSVINLEVFNHEDFLTSYKIFKRYL
jgi:hypothetical protein